MKLSNSIRDEIQREIITKKINPQEKEINDRIHEAIKKYISFRLKDYEKQMKQLPEDLFFPSANCFKMCFGKGYDEYIWSSRFSENERITIPYRWYFRNSDAIIEVEEKEYKKIFSDFYKELKSLEQYKNELSSEVKSVLLGCSTIKKLLEIFPEVTDFIDVSKYKFYAPTVQVDKLRTLIKQ